MSTFVFQLCVPHCLKLLLSVCFQLSSTCILICQHVMIWVVIGFLSSYVQHHPFSVFSSSSGVLRMHKLRTPLVGAQGYQRLPLFKRGVYQNTARTSSILISAFLVQYTSLSPKPLQTRPKGRPRASDVFPPVWNFRAAI